jgi:hypothetical protein
MDGGGVKMEARGTSVQQREHKPQQRKEMEKDRWRKKQQQQWMHLKEEAAEGVCVCVHHWNSSATSP